MRDFLRSSVARVWVPVLAAAAGIASLDRGTDPGDLVYFVHRGEQLLSGGWASTFADPMLQSGPLQLVLFGAVRNLSALAFVLELGTAHSSSSCSGVSASATGCASPRGWRRAAPGWRRSR